MRSHIVVDFGDNVTSLFYWFGVDSLSTLKEKIQKRYEIHITDQSIKHGNTVLSEESFRKLYLNRFKEDVDLKVDIPDPSLIQSERRKVFKRGCEGVIHISSYKEKDGMCPNLTFKPYNLSWTIKDLKSYISTKTNMSVEPMCLLFNNIILLSDKQLCVDYFLDLKGSSRPISLKLKMLPSVIVSDDKFQHRLYYDLCLTPIHVTIPSFDEVDDFVLYPLASIGQIGRPAVIKSLIESLYRIPYGEQELFYEGQALSDNRYPQKSVGNVLEPIYYKLVVFSRRSRELALVYEQNNIRPLHPIHIASFECDHIWEYNYQGESEESIVQFIEDSIKIPQSKQYFFLNGSVVSISELIDKNTQALETLKVKLAVQVDDDELELLKVVQELQISRIRSIVLKHPNNGTIMCEISFSEIEDQRMKISELEYLIFRKHCVGLSRNTCVLLHDDKELTFVDDPYGLLLTENGNSLESNLVLTLFVYVEDKTLFEEADTFSLKYDMKLLKRVNINFLTGQFSFDILQNHIKNIRDVKFQIDKEKGIPPHLQSLFYENKELNDETELKYMNPKMLYESLTFNLVIKPANEVELFVDGNVLDESITITILETASVGKLKEMISERSGVPQSLIILGTRHQPYIVDGENDRIYECHFQDNIVIVSKKVFVSLIKVHEDVIVKENYFIRDFEHDNVKTLLEDMKYRYFDQGIVSMKKNEWKFSTLLKNVGESEFVLVLKPKTECNIL